MKQLFEMDLKDYNIIHPTADIPYDFVYGKSGKLYENLLKAVGAAFLAHDIFDELPAVALLRQNILCALDFFRYQCHIFLRVVLLNLLHKKQLIYTIIGQRYATRY